MNKPQSAKQFIMALPLLNILQMHDYKLKTFWQLEVSLQITQKPYQRDRAVKINLNKYFSF